MLLDQPLSDAYGRLILCRSTTCGNTEKNNDEVPYEELKIRWKEENLKNIIGLSLTSCLGMCKISNSAVFISSDRSIYFGNLKKTDYENFYLWAKS